ncbi:MAG: cadherin-like domain-containing protein [Gammaproteobacteria bacterium]|nr:cadherin-like domain-containing protein [Gammaproteobacteria bacterium]
MLLALGVLLVGAMSMTQVVAATLDIAVISNTDDAEENASTGVMSLSSTDLEMPWDGSKRQQMGMRFQNVAIPTGVTITKAYIQFTVDRADAGGVVNLTVKGQKAVAPVRFSTASYDISSRARTTASVNWLPSSWTTAGENGTNQRTPDLSAIMQEVIGQAGWTSGNPVVLLIEDNGGDNRAFRAASTFDASSGAPVLHIEYGATPPGGSGFQQDGSGLLSMEAENYQLSVAAADGHQWLSVGSGFGGYSGTDAMRALPEDNVSNATNYASLSPRLDYEANFSVTGTHYVWVRAQAPSTSSDSVHVGLDGQEISSSKNIVVPVGGYFWVGTKANGARATMNVGTAGPHRVNVWMRESGTVIDKVVLTLDAAFDPSIYNGGLGPDESPQGGVANNPPIAEVDTLTTPAGTQAVVNVLANDTDGGDGGVLSLIAYDALSVSGATVNCTSAGSCTYTPVAGFDGADSFTYRLSDGIDIAVGQVNVTVTALPNGGGGDFQQDGNGLLSMEAENFQVNAVSADGHQWLSAGAGFAGYSGSDALRAMPADNIVQSSGYADTGARLGYQVNFSRTGKHYVWVRARGPTSSSNSLHVGLNGQEVSSSKNMTVPITGGYAWVGTISSGSRATLNIDTAGLHTVNVWMRESGTVIDKLVLSTDAAFDPSTINGGQGPSESPQNTPVLPSGLVHYWKFDETSGSTFQDQIGTASAACTDCPAQVTGRVSNARSFNGSTNKADVTSVSAINWTSNSRFSIEYWMKASSCGGSQAIAGRRDPATQLRWWVGCQNGNAVFTLVDKNGGGSALTLTGSSNVADGNWHHIVAIRDAVSGQNRLYVDGAQQVSASVDYAAGFDSAVALNIGWLNESGADYHFAGSIDEVAIHNRVLPDSEILRHYTDGAVGLRRGYEGCGAPVRIMALGDSNTRRWNPGFRPQLYFNLMSAGADFDMVGSIQDSCAPNCSHDPDNEGHSGYTATNIATNVTSWLNQNPPDVIMLHIGTNVDSNFPYPNVTQVGQILDMIKGYNPNIPVVLARIINKARGSYDPQLTVFNQSIDSLAQSRIAAGDKIIVVNMEPALGYTTSTTDFAVGDDLHPTAGGYAKMTPVWFDGLNRFIPTCVNVIPQVVSLPVTTAIRNATYVYVAKATGLPAPVFSLTAAPAGMTVHPDTGRLEWTPAQSGSYGVTVKVANSLGSSTQSFTLVVQ